MEAARARIAPFTRVTPLLVPEPAIHRVALKLENLQISGSFKLRGALNRMMVDEGRHRRVAAASGGNHGIAVAYAARELGLGADVFVPASCPSEKRRLIEQSGAQLHIVEKPFQLVDELCRSFASESGALYLHPYDDPEIVAGQGTVALEILEQSPDVSSVVVAVGGGGLASGIAAGLGGRAKLIAVEPERCPTLNAALAAGTPVPVDVGGVAEDSLGAPILGAIAYGILARAVEGVTLVSDDAILRAQQSLWDAARLMVEPAAACAWAAVTQGMMDTSSEGTMVVVCCGGNIARGRL